MQRLLEHHGAVLEQRRQRRVGGHAVVQPVGREADVMAAGDAGLAALAEARGGTQPQAQRRPAGERLHAAHEHHGPEHAAAAAKPRREIEDAHHAAVRVVQPRLEDRGIAQVVLFGAREVEHVDREHALVRVAALFLQQRREHRVAVRAAAGRPTPCAPVRRSARPPGSCRSRRSSRRHRQSSSLLSQLTHGGRARAATTRTSRADRRRWPGRSKRRTAANPP